MEFKVVNKYLNEDWITILQDFVLSDSFDLIFNVLKEHSHVLPPSEHCFRAFNCCSHKQMKVLILGQDPYHTVKGEMPVANGLAFSSGVYGFMPPSLKNILKEAKREQPIYDLYQWAEQGVLLLNTALTVKEGEPNCHTNIWRPFTEFVLKRINETKKDVVVMLWGTKAKSYRQLLSNQIILEAGHPSPLNTSADKFIGCNHFEICNHQLKKLGKKEIVW